MHRFNKEEKSTKLDPVSERIAKFRNYYSPLQESKCLFHSLNGHLQLASRVNLDLRISANKIPLMKEFPRWLLVYSLSLDNSSLEQIYAPFLSHYIRDSRSEQWTIDPGACVLVFRAYRNNVTRWLRGVAKPRNAKSVSNTAYRISLVIRHTKRVQAVRQLSRRDLTSLTATYGFKN